MEEIRIQHDKELAKIKDDKRALVQEIQALKLAVHSLFEFYVHNLFQRCQFCQTILFCRLNKGLTMRNRDLLVKN